MMNEFRDAIAEEVDSEGEIGLVKPMSMADAVLAMPEMEAIRAALYYCYDQRADDYGDAEALDWLNNVCRFPSVVAWVMEVEA